ncbi:MAG: TetR/AcrR family transcriptional regulator [Actinomycetota bacterium]|nr:MAG: TetR/AcrR family transcriptional regulator [Actinomycetota bacterium]
MPSQPRRRTPSTDVEQALVDAAERVLVRDGPAAVTVRAVATEAGVAPMGVYNHLGGKQGLTDALLERGFRGLRAAVAAASGSDALARLRDSGRGYRRYALTHPQHYAIMFDRVARPGSYQDPTIVEAADAFGALVSHVVAAMDSGQIRPEDPSAVALRIWCTVHGALSLELRGFIDPAIADGAYELLLDYIIRAVAVEPADR